MGYDRGSIHSTINKLTSYPIISVTVGALTAMLHSLKGNFKKIFQVFKKKKKTEKEIALWGTVTLDSPEFSIIREFIPKKSNRSPEQMFEKKFRQLHAILSCLNVKLIIIIIKLQSFEIIIIITITEKVSKKKGFFLI